MTQHSTAEPHVHDLVGVGFGPSNLALAIAVREGADHLDALFLEGKAGFGWHRGMLLEDATMQVSFLKDLVTLRNPSSDFSFLSFLHSERRLADFVNHKTLFPLRIEFHDYLAWAADRCADAVRYGCRVTGVAAVDDGSGTLDVRFEGPDGPGTVRTRALVVAPGLRPWTPPGVGSGERVWHTHELLDRLDGFAERCGEPRRLVVVGAGQSGAEAVAHLHERFPRAEVHAVFARYGYSPADDSPFVNRIFDPDAVDRFHGAPDGVRDRILGYHANTNYSVVDTELIEDLYARHYRETVLRRRRLVVHNVSEVAALDDRGDTVRVTVRSLLDGAETVLDADAVVHATGYRPVDPRGLLGGLAERCRTDDAGRVLVGRDYRLDTGGPERVYVQGDTERSHGLSSLLLSVTAVRVGEILGSLRAALAEVPEPAASPAG